MRVDVTDICIVDELPESYFPPIGARSSNRSKDLQRYFFGGGRLHLDTVFAVATNDRSCVPVAGASTSKVTTRQVEERGPASPISAAGLRAMSPVRGHAPDNRGRATRSPLRPAHSL